EDGSRDRNVTGVQTCALPIYLLDLVAVGGALGGGKHLGEEGLRVVLARQKPGLGEAVVVEPAFALLVVGEGVRVELDSLHVGGEIGRASCRERGEVGGVGDGV